jgi:hypothetical protein
MADDNTNAQQPPEPDPDLKSLDRLVGTWEMSGEVHGRVSFEWMEGGFFLIQHVDLEQHGQRIKGIEIIGREKPFGSEPSEEIKSRFYSNTGDTLDYVYELEGTRSRSGLERRVLRHITRASLVTMATPSPAPGTTPEAAVTSQPRPGSSKR